MSNRLNSGEIVYLSLRNPNATSRATKDGQVYRVSFELTQEEWQMFADADTTGMVFECCGTTGAQDLPADELKRQLSPAGEPAWQAEASELRDSGYFCREDVWESCGTPLMYMEWTRRRPSCISGKYSEYKNGEGRCVVAHVSRIERGRGVGFKPKWWLVPLTNDEHMHQHNQGELDVLVANDILKEGASVEDAREWFDQEAMKNVSRWAESLLVRAMGADQLAQINPSEIALWAQDKGVFIPLPPSYQGDS